MIFACFIAMPPKSPPILPKPVVQMFFRINFINLPRWFREKSSHPQNIWIYDPNCVYIYIYIHGVCMYIYIYTFVCICICVGYMHTSKYYIYIYMYGICTWYIYIYTVYVWDIYMGYIYIIYVCMYGNVMLCYIVLCNVK